MNEDNRRKRISEEDACRYRNIANENKRMDRKFCASYEYLLASITCTMEHCKEVGCVIKLLTKGNDFKVM